MSISHYKSLAQRYPQLVLPIAHGIKDTLQYRNAVLRGLPTNKEPEFFGSLFDAVHTEHTPAGDVDIIVFGDRRDFIHAFRALAYRCEPVDIPDSIGATIIRGLINHKRINDHHIEYLKSGGTDWTGEFKRFTADKRNYIDTVILLSTGFYSAVTPDAAGFDEAEWKHLSLIIRKYHELTHFVMRSIMPEDTDALRDEVIADAVGIHAALGHYDANIALVFLGISGQTFQPGGRLSHYISPEDIDAATLRARSLIHSIRSIHCESKNAFSFLELILHELS